MTTPHIPPEQLIAELRTIYPTMKVRALVTPEGEGAWITGIDYEMPDGKPIFIVPGPENGHEEPDGYSCWVHEGFLSWLELRGYYVETYDYGSYWVVPIAAAEAVV